MKILFAFKLNQFYLFVLLFFLTRAVHREVEHHRAPENGQDYERISVHPFDQPKSGKQFQVEIFSQNLQQYVSC